jgi:hypothetical protein
MAQRWIWKSILKTMNNLSSGCDGKRECGPWVNNYKSTDTGCWKGVASLSFCCLYAYHSEAKLESYLYISLPKLNCQSQGMIVMGTYHRSLHLCE